MNTARRDNEWLCRNRGECAVPSHDIVQNPAHYTQGRKYEPIDVIEDWELPFHLGNALKYIARAGRKDASLTRQDISKAIWYLERFNEQFEESEAQAKDADTLLASLDLGPLDQEEIEYQAMGEFGTVSFGSDEDPEDDWDEDSEEPWDPSLDPYEPVDRNGNPVKLPGKDLSKFEDYEIVTTHHVDGSILGTQKNGDVVVLGRWDLYEVLEVTYDDVLRADPDDLTPSEFEH